MLAISLMLITTVIKADLPAVLNAQTCEVGLAALQDVPSMISPSVGPNWFYHIRPDQGQELLAACPNLKRIADKMMLAETAPPRDQTTKIQSYQSFKFVAVEIDVPVVNDMGDRATVKMGYFCNGMCGARFLATYVKERDRWALQSRVITSVS